MAITLFEWAAQELVGVLAEDDPRYSWDIILLAYFYLDAQAMQSSHDESERWPSEQHQVMRPGFTCYTSYSWII